ncbi:pitrilysin family protein [uncultured Paludibaculum sp.]|uniref:M16 family metallopeptidase n=1 Tax=uncultured Paludibaculum sp. TaxID=1765020 RepID=UPI002AAB31C4|nr:pitrilysin family protein [uncultured Paludibaculum sp.]
MSKLTLERDICVSTLSNGIRVITEPMPAVRSVAVGFWIGTGSRCETIEENGTSHFIEHMLFKGTPKRSAEAIAREVDAIGGHLDAFTGRELVGYNTKVLDEHMPLAFEILSDMLLNPRFDISDIEKEKGVVLEELKMENDSPETFVHELFVSNFWKHHSLGRPILGTKKTIAAFCPENLRGYHQRYYRPENITLTAAGSLRHEDLIRVAEQYLSPLTVGGKLPDFTTPPTAAPLILKNRRSLQQVHLCLGVPMVPATHPLRFAAYTLNVILGGGMSSRLFQNIRERQGLAYSIFSELNLYRDTGLMAIYAGTSSETARKLLDGVMVELRRLKNDPLPADELRHAKDHMKGSLMLSLESTSSRMSNLARQWMNFGKFFTLDELADCIEAVTADEVLSVAREYFDSEKIGLAMLGRLEGLTVTREDLSC